MGNAKFQRKYLRAPLRSEALYIDEESVFKAKIVNISEGGILLSELPHVPEINGLPLAIALINYPKFSACSPEDIKTLNVNDFTRTIVKIKARMVRAFEGKSTVQKLFLTHIGCEFYPLSPDSKELINEYVGTFAKNIIFLLSLFESNMQKKDHIELIRKTANLLGYESSLAIPLLRQKILHDYQSLESL